MTSVIFQTELNKYCQKFLVKNNNIPTPSPFEFSLSTSNVKASLFEQFLLFDKITFKVHGENIPLVILLNLFGVKGVEALLKQNALAFTLWDQQILHFVENVEGVDPLCFGALNSPAHSDPEESIKLGFSWMATPLSVSEKKTILRKVRRVYSSPEKDLSGKTLKIAKSIFESGKLRIYGLDPEQCEYRTLNTEGKKTLSSCSEELMEYSHLIKNGMISYTNHRFFKLLENTKEKLISAQKINDNFEKITQIESVPDFKKLISKIDEPFQKVIKVRDKGSSQKFRDWLFQCSSSQSGVEITKEYIDAIEKPQGFFEGNAGRLSKTIALSCLGGGFGTLVAGPAGTALGVGAGVGLDLLDKFVLSKVTKGWTPRVFLEDIRRLEHN